MGDTPDEDNVNKEDSTRDKNVTQVAETKNKNDDFSSHENEPGYSDAQQETLEYSNPQEGESYKSSESNQEIMSAEINSLFPHPTKSNNPAEAPIPGQAEQITNLFS